MTFSVDRAGFLEDAAGKRFLGSYPPETAYNMAGYLLDFLVWLQGLDRFRGLSPSQLVEFQANAEKKDQFSLLDALQEYIRQKPGTYNSLKKRHSAVLMFFKKNRTPLPDDDFQIRGSREPVQSRLTVEIIKNLVSCVDLDFKPFYLTLWMSLMDQERFMIFNRKYAGLLSEHLKTKGVDVPFRIDFSGRKQNKNRPQSAFCTFIGHDALAAWREYFERIRGWPKDGEAILLDQDKKPATKVGVSNRHLRLLERLNYIDRGGEIIKRYGMGLHDFRDTAKTILHLQGKQDGLDLDCVDHWMGHEVDPNQYDKFHMDEAYVLKHYKTAEKYLNIVSGTAAIEKQEKKLQEYEKQIQSFRDIAAEAMQRVAALEEKFRATGQ